MNAALFRRLACRPAAFCAVWDGQAKGETPLADFKFHAARVRVCVGLAALTGVSCGIGGQPVLEVGVVGADMDKRLFLIKPNIGGLFLLRKPCSHASSFLRPCYAIGVFFGCFLRLMTWGKRRFSNRSTPDNARVRPTRSCWLFSYFYGSTP
mgnify:CR=1 FL=1